MAKIKTYDYNREENSLTVTYESGTIRKYAVSRCPVSTASFIMNDIVSSILLEYKNECIKEKEELFPVLFNHRHGDYTTSDSQYAVASKKNSFLCNKLNILSELLECNSIIGFTCSLSKIYFSFEESYNKSQFESSYLYRRRDFIHSDFLFVQELVERFRFPADDDYFRFTLEHLLSVAFPEETEETQPESTPDEAVSVSDFPRLSGNSIRVRYFSVCYPVTNDLDEIIAALRNSTSFTKWAYCIHNKDIFANEKHIHIAVKCQDALSIKSISRHLGVPEHLVHRLNGREAFLDCIQYLEKQQKLGKCCDDSEVVSSDSFSDRRERLNSRKIKELTSDEYTEMLGKFQKSRQEYLNSDTAAIETSSAEKPDAVPMPYKETSSRYPLEIPDGLRLKSLCRLCRHLYECYSEHPSKVLDAHHYECCDNLCGDCTYCCKRFEGFHQQSEEKTTENQKFEYLDFSDSDFDIILHDFVSTCINDLISIEGFCEKYSYRDVISSDWYDEIKNRTIKRFGTIRSGDNDFNDSFEFHVILNSHLPVKLEEETFDDGDLPF